jgi:hypothetical protein
LWSTEKAGETVGQPTTVVEYKQVIGIPVALLVFNRTPFIASLHGY